MPIRLFNCSLKSGKKDHQNQMAIGTAIRIIKKGINNNIFNNIINITNPEEM